MNVILKPMEHWSFWVGTMVSGLGAAQGLLIELPLPVGTQAAIGVLLGAVIMFLNYEKARLRAKVRSHGDSN